MNITPNDNRYLHNNGERKNVIFGGNWWINSSQQRRKVHT
jgi:hypothetical protein